MIIERKIANR